MTNATLLKFGYPNTLIADFDHWVVLLRPAQVTLGSLVLAAKSDSTCYSDLPDEAFREQGRAVRSIEQALGAFCRYDRINYLMLMMVDPNVHFHVFPRYSETREWRGLDFPDAGWPGIPELKSSLQLTSEQLGSLAKELKTFF
jgi:diadenosine tetraphosphate (Ap4A) HIT family hydrolase